MTYLCVLAWRCVGAADVAASIASALFGLTEFRVQSSEFTLAKSRDEHDEDEQVDTDKETDVEDDERWCSRPHRRISRRRLRAHRLRARLRLRRRLQARRLRARAAAYATASKPAASKPAAAHAAASKPAAASLAADFPHQTHPPHAPPGMTCTH